MKGREGGGENRWIKRGNTMKREWDTVLRQWHWQRALSNVQGNKIGSYCRRTLICILFFVLFCPLFFCWLCLWECVRGDFSVCLPDCASFHFFCIFLAYFLQLLMRYVKTSTFSPCHGKEPPLEKLSTTNVQLMPLVSHMICFSQSVIHQYNSVIAFVSDFVILFGLELWILISSEVTKYNSDSNCSRVIKETLTK